MTIVIAISRISLLHKITHPSPSCNTSILEEENALMSTQQCIIINSLIISKLTTRQNIQPCHFIMSVKYDDECDFAVLIENNNNRTPWHCKKGSVIVYLSVSGV